jgi:hypothetical protein
MKEFIFHGLLLLGAILVWAWMIFAFIAAIFGAGGGDIEL